MVTVTTRRNGHFSVPYSVAASITLAIAFLVVFLASPARGENHTSEAFFEFERGKGQMSCIGYEGIHCSGAISKKATLKTNKCYKTDTVPGAVPKYVKLVDEALQRPIISVCSDNSCKTCFQPTGILSYNRCYRAAIISPLCTATPAE